MRENINHYVAKLFVLGAFLFLGMTADIFAAGGNLDTGFNGSGKSVFNVESSDAPSYFVDVAVIGGDKFLVAGHAEISSSYYAITLSRFNSDGSLDTSFGAGGKVITDVGVYSQAVALAVQPDGKIVVTGNSGDYPNRMAVILRYTPDGVLDNTFGNNGIIFIPVQFPRDITVLADGKILVAGSGDVPNTTNDGVRVAKLNANGSLDTTFGTNGIASSTVGSGSSANKMAIQSDGKIVVSGRFGSRGLVNRFNTDGSLDSTFGTGGVREIVGPNFTQIYTGGGIAIQPDGKIVLAGAASSSSGNYSALLLARLNSDGSSDESFGSFGLVMQDLTADPDGALDLVLQSDGKIVIGGQQDEEFAIAARFNSNGAIDTGFGNNGVRLLSDGRYVGAISLQGNNFVAVGPAPWNGGIFLARVDQSGAMISYRNEIFLVGKNDTARDVAIQPDGKIVAVGVSENRWNPVMSVARLLPDGSLDTAFGSGGIVTLNNGISASEAYSVKLQPDGKILVAGRNALFSNFSSYYIFVVRLNPDGSLDSTFGTGGKASISNGSYLVGYDMELQPDGKIVIGGRAERWIGDGVVDYDMMAARLNANGTPDGGFGSNGVFEFYTGAVGSQSHEHARALSILPNGKIILAGTHLLRLDANGTVDAAFSSAPVSLGFTATDIELQSDGKFLLSVLQNSDFTLARYNSTGTLDTSFGTNGNGIVSLDFGGADIANTIYLEPNGDILAGGSTLGGSPSRRKFALARFNSNGLPDSSFGSGGKVITDFGAEAEMFGLARQNDGKIVGAGYVKGTLDRDYAVARYLSRSATNAPFDFDGDGKTDLSIFRPAAGEWWYQKSSTGTHGVAAFGASSDKLVPGDFTGDGKTDVANWRPSTGEWFVLRSEDFSYFSFAFGIASDIPAPADYDGDGKTDAAVFRPSTATWFISNSGGGTTIEQFGQTGDVPVVADYDGDGKADIAIYRPSLGQWWILRSAAGLIAATFGNNTDKTVQGDYTGDGKADVAFFRPSTGEWFVLRSEDFSYFAFQFGTAGDIPSPGDYDGDGKADAAVFRPSTSTWFAQRATAGTLIQQYGQAGDISVPNAFVR
jgi:uncharacterized delta-60 repeat protein